MTSATPAAVRAMVVDDQEAFRSVVATVISIIPGWTLAAAAADGEEAVETARREHPDVVIMDINLPGISGIEATRQLLHEVPTARVVLTSTYAERDLPDEAATCGAVGYISKEYLTPAALLELANRVPAG